MSTAKEVLSHPNAVQKTNDSCTVSKWSVVNSGLYDDKILDCFVESKTKQRASLINRCYSVRYVCIKTALAHFLDFVRTEMTHSEIQIVNLGAGFDSLFWRIASDLRNMALRYIEIDFPDVCRRKFYLAKAAGHVQNEKVVRNDDAGFRLEFGLGERHKFVSVGCNMLEPEDFKNILTEVVHQNTPTLVLSEVVFVYMNMEQRLSALSSVFQSFVDPELLIFVTYEQLARPDHDAFTRTMLNSFTLQRSPLLSYYTSPEEFFSFWTKHFGESSITFTTCSRIFFNDLPESERLFICNNESVFDEFEPFHLKCSIYFVGTAFFGRMSEKFASYWRGGLEKEKVFQQPAQDVFSKLNIGKFSVNWRHKCYACSVCQFSSLVNVLVGGFGCHNESGRTLHSRFRSIRKFVANTGDVSNLQTTCAENSFFERMYSTSSALSHERIFIFGGRKSPMCSVLSYGVISLNSNMEFGLNRSYKLDPTNIDNPSPRFRHVSCVLTLKGREFVFISGGRCVDGNAKVFGDFWLFDIAAEKWLEVKSICTFKPRHSHSVAAKGESSAIVFGGLCCHEVPLCDLSIIDVTPDLTLTRHEIATTPALEPRYGHSVELIEDNLIIIGGICPLASPFSSGEILVVDLKFGLVRQYRQEPSASPFMFINHCTYVEERNEERNLMVLGGGANCFSFGTHFNSQFLRIPLKSLSLES